MGGRKNWMGEKNYCGEGRTSKFITNNNSRPHKILRLLPPLKNPLAKVDVVEQEFLMYSQDIKCKRSREA